MRSGFPERPYCWGPVRGVGVVVDEAYYGFIRNKRYFRKKKRGIFVSNL